MEPTSQSRLLILKCENYLSLPLHGLGDRCQGGCNPIFNILRIYFETPTRTWCTLVRHFMFTHISGTLTCRSLPSYAPSSQVDDIKFEVGVDEHVGAVLVDHTPPWGTLVRVEPAQLAALNHLHPTWICETEDTKLPVPPPSNPRFSFLVGLKR